jgi:hypothetical protein
MCIMYVLLLVKLDVHTATLMLLRLPRCAALYYCTTSSRSLRLLAMTGAT